MVWWSISLPFQGVSLLFSRTFFSLQRPWATTALAGLNLARERGARGGALRAARHRRHRDRHGGRHRRHVRGAGAGCCAATWAASRAGAPLGARRCMLARRGPARRPRPTGSGTGSTPRWGGRSPRRRWRCCSGIAAGLVAYAAACGCCACRRRARSGACDEPRPTVGRTTPCHPKRRWTWRPRSSA